MLSCKRLCTIWLPYTFDITATIGGVSHPPEDRDEEWEIVMSRHSIRRGGRTFALGAALLAASAASAWEAGEPLSNLGKEGNDNGFAIAIPPTTTGTPRVPIPYGAVDLNNDGQPEILLGGLKYNGGTYLTYSGPMVDVDLVNPITDTSFLFSNVSYDVNSSGPDNNFGSNATRLGDFDGDGISDAGFGATSASKSGGSHGYIIPGGRTYPQPLSLQSILLDRLGLVFQVTSSRFPIDLCGTQIDYITVSGLGDFDGDGLGDALVRGPENRILFGHPLGDTLLESTSSIAGALPGVEILSTPGATIRSAIPAGDFNGDGYADLAFDAASYIVLGGPGTRQITVEASRDDVIAISPGLSPENFAGFAIGDFNGDGYSDHVAYRSPNGYFGSVECYVILGRPEQHDSTITEELAAGRALPIVFGGLVDGLNIVPRDALDIAGAGDVDGDGLADLLIGFTAITSHVGYAGKAVSSGMAFLVYGREGVDTINLRAIADNRTTTPGYGNGGRTYLSTYQGERVGTKVKGLGDIDGDGLSDYAIGSAETLYVSYSRISPFETWFQYTRPVSESGVYRSFAHDGNAPLLGVGHTAGEQEEYPFSRAWIGFTGGTTSRQDVTLTRSNASINLADAAGQTLGEPANVLWKIETDRTGYSAAQVQFRYLDSDIASLGVAETALALYRAADPAGPWTSVPISKRNIVRNTIAATVPTLGYFAIGTTTQPFAPVTEPAPTDGASVADPGVTLTWMDHAGALSYDVHVGVPGTLFKFGTTSQQSWHLMNLEPGRTYAWRVDSNFGDTVVRGTEWTFSTESCAAAVLSNPVPPNASVVPPEIDTLQFQRELPTFGWTGPECEATYEVWFGTTNPPTQHRMDATLSPVVSIDGLTEPGETYYWQVRAQSPSGEDASPVWSFTVKQPGPGELLGLTEFTDLWVSRLDTGTLTDAASLGFIGFRHDPGANWMTLAGDFDGDGFTDLVTVTADGEAWTATFEAPDAFSVPNKQSSGWYADPALGFNVLAGDFNGDGLTDL
ncbi:MAG: hypothetical protein PWP23_2438, partial [Candidatus Sumerlaeota bacterium]|nr:hypothetical protein [Candidatus Sumerlaeota bacterium]